MAEINETTVLEPPRVYLVHMVVFTLVVVVLIGHPVSQHQKTPLWPMWASMA